MYFPLVMGRFGLAVCAYGILGSLLGDARTADLNRLQAATSSTVEVELQLQTQAELETVVEGRRC